MSKMARIAAACMAALVTSGVVSAGPLEDGIAALDRGQYRQAHQLFLEAAKAGNAEAEVQIATLLLEGTGIGRNPKEAAGWLMRAAKRGHVYAMYRLGTLLEDGIGGARNAAAAADWYQRAMERGNPNAAFRLAGLYDRGLGKPADRSRALSLYREASQAGVLKAKHALGSILTQRGEGAAAVIEGVGWLELAWDGGDGDVIDELKKARARLTDAQRASVQAWVKSHVRDSRHHSRLR